tara:strand:- start:10366 stop:10722 length:357 start_codon:yes stop_codon:yes gene_type:complete
MLVYYNLDVIQGSTFSAQLSIKNSDGTAVDLDGYSVRGKLKYNYGTGAHLVDLDPKVNTTAPLTAASGVIDVKLTAAQTADLPVIMGVYDIETFNDSDPVEVNKVLDGKVKVHPEVTR